MKSTDQTWLAVTASGSGLTCWCVMLGSECSKRWTRMSEQYHKAWLASGLNPPRVDMFSHAISQHRSGILSAANRSVLHVLDTEPPKLWKLSRDSVPASATLLELLISILHLTDKAVTIPTNVSGTLQSRSSI